MYPFLYTLPSVLLFLYLLSSALLHLTGSVPCSVVIPNRWSLHQADPTQPSCATHIVLGTTTISRCKEKSTFISSTKQLCTHILRQIWSHTWSRIYTVNVRFRCPHIYAKCNLEPHLVLKVHTKCEIATHTFTFAVTLDHTQSILVQTLLPVATLTCSNRLILHQHTRSHLLQLWAILVPRNVRHHHTRVSPQFPSFCKLVKT